MKKGLVFMIAVIMVVGLVVGCTQPAASPSASPSAAPSATTAKPAPSPSSSPAPSPTATTPAAVTPQSGGVLRIISMVSPLKFGYPPETAGSGISRFLQPVEERLFNVDHDGKFTQKQSLSTSYAVAADGKSITFNLRKGVKFHDGTPWNAEAAKWNLDIQMAGKLGGTALWTSIDVVDEYTVKLNIKNYSNDILTTMSSAYFMVSPTAIKTNGKEWAYTHPVGTGPFKFKAYTTDTSLEYERFDDYWGGKPYLDGVKFIIMPDGTAAGLAFKSGAADVIEARDPTTAAGLKAAGYSMYNINQGYGTLNGDSANPDSPYAKLQVRQAVEYAIDKKSLVDAVGQGFYTYTNQPALPDYFGYNKDLKGRDYDVATAKKLLADAGYPTGFTTSLIGYNAIPQDFLVVIQKNLADVGIKADIQYVPQAAYTNFEHGGWKNALLYFPGGANVNFLASINYFFSPQAAWVKSLARPAGWAEALNKALTDTDYNTMLKDTQAAVQFAHDNSVTMFTHGYSYPYFYNKNVVHDANFFQGGDIFEWNPGKAWMSK
jgi:peptide/nickel transport system substrate-binding protein